MTKSLGTSQNHVEKSTSLNVPSWKIRAHDKFLEVLLSFVVCHAGRPFGGSFNGSSFQPSPVVPTKVAPLANPAISNTGLPRTCEVWRQGFNSCYKLIELAAITICLATPNFGQYSGIFTPVKKLNNLAQRIKRKIWYIRDVLSKRLALYCQMTSQSPRPSDKSF